MTIYVTDYLNENVITELGCSIVPVGIEELENLVCLIMNNIEDDDTVYLHTRVKVVFKYPDSKSVLQDIWWLKGEFDDLSPTMQKMWDNAYIPKALECLEITFKDIVYIFSHCSGNIFKVTPNQLPY